MDSNKILEWYETQLSKLGTGYDVKVLEDVDIEITTDFIERLASGEEQGTSYAEAGTDENGNTIYAFPGLSN